jgi:2-polyprenyl-3-methyl-5-hydroxy-6-metoxy-1,4-benzoquinol methylase
LIRFSISEHLTRCDLCGSADLRPRDVSHGIQECGSCGYRFVNPRPSQKEIADAYSNPHFYDEWIADDAGRRDMWRARWKYIHPFIAGNRLLDVGAGMGTFMSIAQAAGWNVTGTEVSRSAIQLGRERYGLAILEGALDRLTLDQGFDVISLWHVLEHLPSPSVAVRRCNSLLAPNGVLIVAVPNDSDARWWLTRLKNSRGSYSHLVPGAEVHLSHFEPSVLAQVVVSNGFELLRITVDDHYPVPNFRSRALVWIYRLIMRIADVNLGQATLLIARKNS